MAKFLMFLAVIGLCSSGALAGGGDDQRITPPRKNMCLDLVDISNGLEQVKNVAKNVSGCALFSTGVFGILRSSFYDDPWGIIWGIPAFLLAQALLYPESMQMVEDQRE
ncbi:MAG: hypothetical protein ACPGXY_05145 [Alphaproteobacteria bacterium]